MTCHSKGRDEGDTATKKSVTKHLFLFPLTPQCSQSLSQLIMSRLLWHVVSVARFCKLTNIQVYITQAPPEWPPNQEIVAAQRCTSCFNLWSRTVFGAHTSTQYTQEE